MSDFLNRTFNLLVNLLAWFFSNLTWANFLLGIGVVTFLWLLRSVQRDKHNKFDALDYLLDEQSGKASYGKLITLIMAAGSIWVMVVMVNRDKDVTELVLGVLTIFVLKEEVKRYTQKDQNVVTSSSIVTETTKQVVKPTVPPAGGDGAPEAIAILQPPDTLVDRPPKRKK